jgi:hypothetical protein
VRPDKFPVKNDAMNDRLICCYKEITLINQHKISNFPCSDMIFFLLKGHQTNIEERLTLYDLEFYELSLKMKNVMFTNLAS